MDPVRQYYQQAIGSMPFMLPNRTTANFVSSASASYLLPGGIFKIL